MLSETLLNGIAHYALCIMGDDAYRVGILSGLHRVIIGLLTGYYRVINGLFMYLCRTIIVTICIFPKDVVPLCPLISNP